jgi:N-acetylneuraminic acid mutarotase
MMYETASMLAAIVLAGAMADGSSAVEIRQTAPIEAADKPDGGGRAVVKAGSVKKPPASKWRKIDGGPGPRYALQSVWDSRKNRLLIFGGETNLVKNDKPAGSVFHDDVWAFDPKTGTWTELRIAGDKPSRRGWYAACFDTARSGIWVHGGFDGGRIFDELWFFDCGADSWTKVSTKGPVPPFRDYHSMVYNAKAGQLMIFGGLRDFGRMELLDDQWTFDIETSTWTQVTPDGNRPPARFGQTTAWDEDGQRLFVQGGVGAGGQYTAPDLWTYDAAKKTWAQQAGAGARNFAAGQMVYVADRDQLLIFGGQGSNIEYWCDLGTGHWTPAAAAAPAEGRGFHAMALDPATNRLFVFGGVRKTFADACVPGTLWIATLPQGRPAATTKQRH